MFNISKKTTERLVSKLKTHQKTASSLQKKDVSEADGVTLIKDIFADCFGYDKYQELKSEQPVRGKYCDLAVYIDEKLKLLIEIKSPGLELRPQHVQQAVEYGANKGIEWVVLTNSVKWHLYRIKFGKPFQHEEFSSFDFLEINPKNGEDLDKLYLLCREGVLSNAMKAYYEYFQVMNRYILAQILLTPPIVDAVRKEFNKLFPGNKSEREKITAILSKEVLKVEVLDSDKAKEAERKIKSTVKKKSKLDENAKRSAATPDDSVENENTLRIT